MIDKSFQKTDVKWGPDVTLLHKAQINHMSIVLERVLQTTDGKRFTRKHEADPREIWKQQLEASIINNTSTRKANSSDTDYLTPNSPSNTFFSYSSESTDYMVNQDVDMVQYTLKYNQPMKEGKPCPP